MPCSWRRFGPLRKALLRQDREQGDNIVNPFIERVAEFAHGLPIYVTYVVGDILAGRHRHLDANERLRPRSNATTKNSCNDVRWE